MLQPLPEPVRRVSIAIDPVADVPQSELDGLAQAIAKPLILSGVAVTPPGPLIPQLLGHATDYRPDLHLTALWQVIAPDGTTIGQLRTDYGVSIEGNAVDWGDVVQGTGTAIAEFLAAR